jgi:hypothetical protein
MPDDAYALKPELLRSLGTLRRIDAVAWDVLGEHLAIQVQAGPFGRSTVPVIWTVPRELVKELHFQLGQALEEIGSAEQPKQ